MARDSADPSDPSGRKGDTPLAPAAPRTETAEKAGVRAALEQLIEGASVPQTQPQPVITAPELRGRVAIVTGGSSGIGRGTALALAANGVHIAFNYLDDGPASVRAAQKVLHELRELEVRALCRSCDVRDPADVRGFVAQTIEELGGVHILVNNAGIGRDAAIWRMEDSEWQAVLRTNLDGAFHFIRAVAGHMRAQEWGKIVNIASVHGLVGEFGLANSISSKAGLIGLTRSAAVELGSRNVNVNAVAPGYIRTSRLTDRVPAEQLDRARERSALGRLGDPQDVAGVVLFLCSEAARHITGVVIPVDGGYLVW
jgi:3-oxoacyl-[acyl-carrier protein] reductase